MLRNQESRSLHVRKQVNAVELCSSKMKVAVLGLLVFTFFFECCELKERDNLKSLSIAIKEITKTLFDLNGEVVIKSFEQDKQTIQSIILDSVRDEKIPFRVENIKEISKHEPKDRLPSVKQERIAEYLNGNSIISLNSFQSVQECRKTFGKSSKDIIHVHPTLTYVHAFDTRIEFSKEMERNPSFFKDFYFIIEDRDFISLKTFVWFLQGHCSKPSLIEVNKFHKDQNIWETSEFAIKKFRNFNGCEVETMISEMSAIERITLAFLKQNNETFKSIRENADLKLFKVLMNSLNIKPVTRKKIGKFRPHFSLDLRLTDRNTELEYLKVGFFYTQPHVFQNVHFAIPVGEPYNGYEKLILPFDECTWILILLTFFIAFNTTLILRFVNLNIRNFVIGQNVSTPNINVMSIVFGISYPSIPRRNFARFLLMTFVIYCLIMRTAWQGKMFEFMQKDMRKPEVKSVEEMIEKKFTFFVEVNTYNLLKHTDFGHRAQIELKSYKDLYQIKRVNLSDPTFKGAVQIFKEGIRIQMVTSNGSVFKRFLKERVSLQMMCLEFHNNLVVEAFDEKIQHLVAGGFISFFERENIESTNPKLYEHLHYRGPKVLSMRNLKAGFVVWITAVSFAVLVFIGEWIRTFLEYLVVKSVFKAFYKDLLTNRRRSHHLIK